MRLLGISLSQLNIHSIGKQRSLFEDFDGLKKKRNDLNIALDSLQDKYGKNIVRPGTLIDE